MIGQRKCMLSGDALLLKETLYYQDELSYFEKQRIEEPLKRMPFGNSKRGKVVHTTAEVHRFRTKVKLEPDWTPAWGQGNRNTHPQKGKLRQLCRSDCPV